jgi:hypothetical protein
MTRPIRYAALFLIAATGAGAQATSTGGRHAAVILELPASARAQALGGGYAALVDDDAAVFYNAAQLVAPAAPDRSAGLSIQQYFASSTVAALSGAMRLGPGALALGIQVLNYGSEDEIVPDPNFGGQRGMATGGTVSASDMVLSAGYGVTARRVRLGGAAKLVRQRPYPGRDARIAAERHPVRRGDAGPDVGRHAGDRDRRGGRRARCRRGAGGRARGDLEGAERRDAGGAYRRLAHEGIRCLAGGVRRRTHRAPLRPRLRVPGLPVGGRRHAPPRDPLVAVTRPAAAARRAAPRSAAAG